MPQQILRISQFFASAIIICSLLPSSVRAIKCGVCSSGGSGAGLAALRAQFPDLASNVPHCGPGGSPPLTLDCPKDYHAGCLTQTQGQQVAKMCSNIPVQDCKSANGVEYCYCRGELCNLRTSPESSGAVPPPPRPPPAPTMPTNPAPTAPTPPRSFPLDDEDQFVSGGGEGSGGGDPKSSAPVGSAHAPPKINKTSGTDQNNNNKEAEASPPSKNAPSSSNGVHQVTWLLMISALFVSTLLLHISQHSTF